jgi:hypothetical protein
MPWAPEAGGRSGAETPLYDATITSTGIRPHDSMIDDEPAGPANVPWPTPRTITRPIRQVDAVETRTDTMSRSSGKMPTKPGTDNSYHRMKDDTAPSNSIQSDIT